MPSPSATSRPAASSAPSWPRRRRLALQLAGVAIVSVALAFWARGLDLRRLAAALASAAPGGLVAAALIAFACIAWKAAFWRFALAPVAPVSFAPLLRYSLAATVGSILAPARAGDAFRVWILRRRHEVPLSVSLTVVGLEKLGDVGALLLLASPLPWLSPRLPAPARSWVFALAALPVVAVVAIGVVRRHPRWSRMPAFAGLALFEHPRSVGRALSCVGMGWLFDLGAIALVLHAVGAAPTLGRALTVLLFVNLAIAVPLTPGNAGTHELGSALALKLEGVDAETATAFALLYHGLQTIPVLLVGFVDGRALLASARDASARAEASPREQISR